MTSGAVRTTVVSRVCRVSGAKAALGAARRSTSGTRVKTDATAPTVKGVHPRVPVNSSSDGPATMPMENTVP